MADLYISFDGKEIDIQECVDRFIEFLIIEGESETADAYGEYLRQFLLKEKKT